MAEIDVMRAMASEHDLEFVDLTNFGVDPSAAIILNEEVARRLHVVPIKRKFGTPVVATADPDDLGAHDAVRSELGRDFISVVATHEQIDGYLDRMFPPEPKAEEPGGKRSRRKRKVDAEPKTQVDPPTTSTLATDFFSAERVLADAQAAYDEETDGAPAAEGVSEADVEIPVVDTETPTDTGEFSETAPLIAEGDSVADLDSEEGIGAESIADGDAVLPELDIADEAVGDPGAVADGPGESETQPQAGADDATPVDLIPIEVSDADEQLPTGSVRVGAIDDDGNDSAEVPVGTDAEIDVVAPVNGAAMADDDQVVPGDDGAGSAEVPAPASDRVPEVEPVESFTLFGDPSEPAPDPSSGWMESAEPDTAQLSGEPTLTALVDELQSATPETSTDSESGTEATDLPAFDTSAFVAAENGNGSGANTELDELAGLADSLRQASADVAAESGSSERAADLVDEAVASYEEHHTPDPGDDTPDLGILEGLPTLARILVQGGRVPLDQMQDVLAEHDRTGQSIARVLSSRKLVTEADLMWAMATELGLEFVDLDLVGVSFTDAGTIPEATARHHNVLVIASNDGVPVVATANPTDVFAIDDLRTIMGREFTLVVAAPTQITEFIGQVFDTGGGDAANMAMEASLGLDSQESSIVDDIQAVTEEAPIVRYVNLLILQALNERASDVHVEPSETDLRIRYRIDGVLHDVSTAPRSIAPAVITRLKVMADLNVAEHRLPQDGRISLNVGAKGIDLRVATLPTIHGEKIVMRVLDKSAVVLGFSDLGFPDDLLERYESIYNKPYGTILVTGPTGSGKSTTLYTTLTALNNPEKNIIAVEDPVELQLRGVNQVQLNVKAGLTFASALKSILRSDPDIVLVGEIRDQETAVIAIEAALTGHLVLSTLHTNSAAATPMRLIEMGIEPFLVTSSLSAVLAQRLARRLCLHSKEAKDLTEADIVAAGWSLEELEEFGGTFKAHVAVGCSACANTGYRGRKALSELMPMTEEIERCIIEGGSVDDIHRLAVSQGMQTLRQSGLRKAIEGETTLEEVLRVVA